MIRVLPGGRTETVKIDYLALERKIRALPGRHKKTPFPRSAQKGVFIASGMSVPDALKLLSAAEAAGQPRGTSSPSASGQAQRTPPAPAKGRPLGELDLRLAKLRLAALEAPLDEHRN